MMVDNDGKFVMINDDIVTSACTVLSCGFFLVYALPCARPFDTFF